MSGVRGGVLTLCAVLVGLSPLLAVTAREYASQEHAYRQAAERTSLVQQIETLVAEGQIQAALALARARVSQQPDDAALRSALASAFLRNGLRLESRAQLDAVIQLRDGGAAPVRRERSP